MPDYLRAVVVIPNKPISTAKSRTTLPRSYSKESAVFNLSHTAVTVGAFFNEDWEMLRLSTQDRFHQRLRMKMLPELFEVQKMAYDNGALMSTLSGSGSTFFNMVYDEDALGLADKFTEAFPDFEVKVLSFDNDGLVIER